ncbi:MAG: hypothetical protein WBA77_05300 [Microcoleaceae cyanobacterium]
MILIKAIGLGITLLTVNSQFIPTQQSSLKHDNFILLAQAEESIDFPIPEDAANYSTSPTPGIGDAVNFQTELSLDEAIEFYRNQLIEQGLSEREINTAITETTFNLVFEGAENGQAVVVQGVELGYLRNINIRYEKID